MSERDTYQAGVPCWVDTLQPDPDAAGSFYSRLFDWELHPGEDFLLARLRGRDVAGIASLPSVVSPPPDPGWVTSIRVERVEDAVERVRSAGGSVVFELYDASPAGRFGVMADPTGAVFCVWEPELREGAQLVNEPGAWSMSSLQTPDTERAADFYTAVFGWTTEVFELGEEAITMFRLPGYVGGEPEQPVSREVVATMSATSGDEPARWTVDFWVEDVDASAALAEELGGAALVPPFDLPIGRSAVLADPAGAAFSVSRMGPAG